MNNNTKGITTQEITQNKSKNIIIVSTILVLILLVATFFTYQYIQNKKEQQLKAEYESNMTNLVYDMISQSADAESIINTYSSVWNKAIEEAITIETMSHLLNIQMDHLINFFSENDIKFNLATTEVARKGDFDKVLLITKVYFQNDNKLDTLETSRMEITQRIRKMNNPPEEYQKAYEATFQMYSAYDEYVSLAIEPSGSLVSFREQTSELSSNIIKKSKESEARMPLN